MTSAINTSKECAPELNNPEISCEKCQLSFTRKSNYYRHMRRIHHKENLNINRGHVCGICNAKLISMSLLHAHMTEKHDVCMEFTEETFYCEEDFSKWKSAIEKEGKSNFNLVTNRTNRAEGVTVRGFMCNRSGVPMRNKEQQYKRRHSKSIKIGFTCPASIHVVSETVEGISCIKVKYQSVHVGHELSVKLRLSREDKIRLATSLNAGVTIPSLLKDLRENYDPSHPYHQVMYKDLYNISRDFKLSRTRLLQEEEFVNVDMVVKKIWNSDFQSALLVYKPVGEVLPEYHALDKNDFLLGLMNDVQEKLLEMHGRKCIMIDYSDCKNFYLSTVMVRDENNENLCVATLYSSKTSVEILQPFFVAIQLRLPRLKTKIIMTDDIVSFYDAWQRVFRDQPQHLLCSRYVLRNLLRSVEIKVKNENRKDMKSKIKTFLKEEDVATFESMMEAFIEEYEDEENDFITYFQTNYEPKAKKWAYCYRIALGVSPEVRLERWRNILKLDKRGSGKRLDETLSVVNYSIAKKLISTAMVMNVDKLSARVLLGQRRHEESLSIGDECKILDVNEKKCTIFETENGKKRYLTVENLREICGQCVIKCQTCKLCIHSLSCTCVDYSVHFAICKHMHRFCQSFVTASRTAFSQESGDSSCFSDNEMAETVAVRSTEPTSRPNQFIIDDIKARVKTQLELLEKRLDDINFLEVMKNVEDNVKSINMYLDEAIPSSSFSDKIPSI